MKKVTIYVTTTTKDNKSFEIIKLKLEKSYEERKEK